MTAPQHREMDQLIVQIIRSAVPDVLGVYVFGSSGTPYERTDSDLDVALLSAKPQDPVHIWDLAQRLASAVERDVDLIDLRRTSTVMTARIITEGRQLICLDDTFCAAFEAYALADYARLNEERRGILADIQARGRVHG